jgi:hypothetical protein
LGGLWSEATAAGPAGRSARDDNRVDDPGYQAIGEQLERRLQQWIAETGDPFDTGRRLPQTNMLDLGQVFTRPEWYARAPQAYATALAVRPAGVS